MSEKVIVTGVNGFVGHHLVDELVTRGYAVIGVGREASIEGPFRAELSEYMQCDLADYSATRKLPLKGVSAVINLAGLAAVGPSFDNPDLYMRVNTAVLENLCKAAIEQGVSDSVRIVAISSGAVYKTGQDLPLTEDSELDPDSSPYAKSKIAMEEVAQSYRNQGIDCVVARPFNHIGPGQATGFLLPDLYEKVTRAVRDKQPLLMGNLQTKRDYTDVRDVVKAYISLALASSLEDGIYNVCSGTPRSGEEILSMLFDALDIKELEWKIDEAQFRPSDSPELYGSSERLRDATSWAPTLDIAQTVQDFVAWKSNQ